MRRSFNDTDFIKDDNKRIIGVNLGFDFCAEHEVGIKGLYRSFGMKLKDELGFESKRNTLVPQRLFYFLEKGSAVLVFNPYAESPKNLEWVMKHDLYLRNHDGVDKVAGAWDEESFGLHVPSAQNGVPKMLYDAFQAKNGVITLSRSNNPFAGSGLMLLDYTKIPEEAKIKAREDDKSYREEQRKFRQMEKESGVYELLENSGKRFFYLGVQKLDKDGQPLWWLNPYDQQTYSWGWYHTEDLKKWANNEGPVVEKKKDR
jgi:hypothetical protein